MKRTTHKIYVNDRSPRGKFYAGLPTTGGIWCLVDRESLCNNIEVSCTTNVEGRLELSEPWIDAINGPEGTVGISFPCCIPLLSMEHLGRHAAALCNCEIHEHRWTKHPSFSENWIRGWRSHSPAEIHPNQGAKSENVTGQICVRWWLSKKHVYISHARPNIDKYARREKTKKIGTHNAK